MAFFYLEPEVAGSIGENTLMETGVNQPKIIRLHYQFDGWLGDVLLESFPAFIITKKAAEKLAESRATGIALDNVEISKSSQFEELFDDVTLPSFAWLKITGDVGRDDFGIAPNKKLVVSSKVLSLLQKLGLSNASIEPFEAPSP